MTGAVTALVVLFMGIYWVVNGHPVVDGDLTIYKVGFRAVTFFAVGWLLYSAWCSKDGTGRSSFAYAVLLFFYGVFAVEAYASSHPLIVSMLVDLSMALAFALGTRTWHTAASACFTAAVAVSILTYFGLIPFWHRGHVFVDWSQQDLAAILGYMALIITGLGAGDGGIRARDWLGRPSVAAGYMHRSVSRLVSLAKVETSEKA